MRNKEIKDYINVSVVVDIEWGDTRNQREFIYHGKKWQFDEIPLTQADYEIKWTIFTIVLQLLKDVPM